MPNITAIITAYRRPANILPLVQSLRAQSVPAAAIWAWANDPGQKIKAILDQAKLDRIVTSNDNAYFHGRFALALLAPSEFVAIFDDDTMPGENWFANCLETMQRSPGILGAAGVVLHEAGYANRTMHGWQRPCGGVTEVDLVGQAWFLRTEWVKHLFSSPAITRTNGEDIELAARAWRLAGIRSFCPPHPAGDQSRWGSIRGLELGLDDVAASRRVEHLAERKRIVEAEIAAGWRPLFRREEGTGHRAQGTEDSAENALCGVPPLLPLPSGEGRGAGGLQQAQPSISIAAEATKPEGDSATLSYIYTKVECSPRWVTQYSYPLDNDVQHVRAAHVTLRLDAPDDEACCLDCVRIVESLGQGDLAERDVEEKYDCIDCGPALELVRDPLAFLRRARRVLQPGGELMASVANTRRESVVRGLIEGRWQAVNGRWALRFFTRRELEKLLYRAGFRAIAISPAPTHPVSCSSPPPFIKGLPEREGQEFNVEHYSVTATVEPERDYGLTSIVIVTHNELGCTRACLASIRFVTDEPYELIVVDNGSTDGTVEYLRSCSDVKLIANSDNRGFPAAANQGIAASRGAQILLLNNDVLVTTGWLRRMLEALYGDETIGDNRKSKIENPKSQPGLVGPLTNCASGYQEIEVAYTDLACLDGFAWQHAQQHAARRREVDRLIGFCLLVRREVFDEIGFLDERFGIGNFEDDDFCRRARDAGWRLVVAEDAFIHHFGHRSFETSGIDLNALLERNRKVYDEKWGTEGIGDRGQGTEEGIGHSEQVTETSIAADPVPCNLSLIPSTQSAVRCSLSLCMIVRDNERTIRAALESIRPWVDEMIVVDTGSTDATPDICRELGAEVHHFRWPDSFAIARNESLKYARGEWIFWMDSDDVIDAHNGRKLRELVSSLSLPSAGSAGERSSYHPASSTMDVRTPDAGEAGSLALPVLGYVVQVHCPSTNKDGFRELTVVDHVKLFRNRPDLRFEGRIHEQIIPAIRRGNGAIGWTDLFVVHAGAAETPEAKQQKLDRDLRLLKLELQDRPNHSFAHFNLGMTYEVGGRYDEAIVALQRSLELSDPSESQVRKLYSLLVGCLAKVGRYDEARQKCQEGLGHFPLDPELLFRQGQVCHHFGQLAEAERAYRAVLAGGEARHFTSIDSGILGFKTHHNLALVYLDMRDLAKSEAEWRKVTEAAPDHRDGWRGLGECLSRQGKFEELGRLAPQLLSRPALRGLGLAWQAQPLRARRQFTEAGTMLQRAFEELPDDVDVIQAGCQLLFEAGDLAQCETAITHLLRLAPDNPGAHHNLGTLYLRMGRSADAVEPLRKSIALAPNEAMAHLHLGHALAGADQMDGAAREFAEVLRLEPANQYARDALMRTRSLLETQA